MADTFDDAKYRADLETIVSLAHDEYHYVTHILPKYQSNYLRTYLWLASLILASQLGIYLKVMEHGFVCDMLSKQPTPGFYAWAFLSLAASFSAFVLGTDTLRGRDFVQKPFKNFNDLAQLSYEAAFNARSQTLYASVINSLNNSINHQTEQGNSRGKKLRCMSYIILLSVFFTLMAILSLIAA